MKKVLLYSGGMDSWLIDKLWKPDVKVFFDIGTANSNYELERVKKEPNVIIEKLPLSKFEQKDNNYFLPLRNLHFITMAAHYGEIICLGATGSSTHKDKNETFATLSENVINYLLSEEGDRRVQIVMPYAKMSKTEMLAEYIKQGGDINKVYEETFSCYSPNEDGSPCMKCSSCLSKFTAFYNNGYQFDKKTINAFIEGALSNSHCKSDPYKLAVELKYGKKTICVDFDNTVTTKSEFPVTGELREGCKKKLDELKNEGYYLILFTSRVGKDFNECVDFCNKYELPFDEYLQGKPKALAYIDDKAIEFTEWK